MTVPLCLKVVDWPGVDKQRWRDARIMTGFRSCPKPAAQWSEKRCRIVEQGYGQWLSFLLRRGELDYEQPPEARVTAARVELFALQLEARIASWSLVIMLQGLQRMLAVTAATTNWKWLNVVVSGLKRTAKPSRDKRSHMVAPSQVYRLGVELMRCGGMSDTFFGDSMARDGLIIAVLACDPIRIGNLTKIVIGEHLLFEGDRYLLTFDQDETKTCRDLDGELPPEMTPLVYKYLQVHRKNLLARGCGDQTNRLWIDRSGGPMAEHSIRAQVKSRTAQAFGKTVWPHLFRTIAATGVVDLAPEDASLIPDLLGHSNTQTSSKHYILAKGMLAHKIVQRSFLKGRAEAASRLRNANCDKREFDAD